MLHVADVDPRLWDVSPPAGFRVQQWAGAAPEALVAAFAAARNAIGDAPSGESSYREPEWTIDRVRQAEAERREAGDDVRFVVAVHEETGAVVALTGMLVRPGYSDLCWQRDTVVVGSYRGLGLGRVVKAAMMRWLLAEIPGLGRVVTSNAADNAHMIRVNEQLGYKHYADIGRFEGSVEHVDAAIGTSSKTNIPRPRHEAADEELAA
jgi:RimJ/RimL family protein N-acetyltransferase